jgi:hypothetical protein
MNTAFSHALRVTICVSCGAANHASPEGGELCCGVCQDVGQLAPRLDSDAAEHGLSEDERLEKLRAADPGPLPMPADVSALTRGGVLAPDHAADAMAAWQETRRSLRLEVNEVLETRFYFLTRLLYEHMLAQDDDLQLRGVIETALDTATTRRLRQVFRCMLACEAARVDDLTGAEDWLAPCDPRSTDIHTDTVYRYTAAYVASHKRQFDRVLTLLGTRSGDIPIATSFWAICSVLRANAHERRGALDDAVVELADAMARVDGGAAIIETMIRSSDLTLCRQSFVRARGSLPPPAAQPSDDAAPANVRRRWRSIAPWLALSLGFGVLAAFTDASATTTAGQRLDMFFLAMSASFALPLLAMAYKARRR